MPSVEKVSRSETSGNQPPKTYDNYLLFCAIDDSLFADGSLENLANLIRFPSAPLGAAHRNPGPALVELYSTIRTAERYRLQKDYDYAERILRVAEYELCKTYGTEAKELPELLLALALVYRDRNQPRQAEGLLVQVLWVIERSQGPLNETAAIAMLHLAVLARRQHKLERAERLYNLATVLLEKTCGRNDLRIASAALLLADMQQSRSLPSESQSLVQEAFSILEAAFARLQEQLSALLWIPDAAALTQHEPPPHRPTGTLRVSPTILSREFYQHLKSLSQNFAQTAEYRKSRRTARYLLRTSRTFFGPGHIATAEALADYGCLLHQIGRNRGAARYLQGALELLDRSHLGTSRLAADICDRLSDSHEALGALGLALEFNRRAGDVRRKLLT